jgi:tetratricopeptide (TPR) repeat protein
MKRPFIIIITLLLIVVISASIWLNPTIEIFNDLNEIRNTTMPAQNELMRHYRNIDLIDSLIINREYDSAIAFINDILTKNPDSRHRSNYFVRKGELLYDQEKFTEAKQVFSEAILESDSFNLKAFVWRGYTFALLGDCDSAKLDLLFAVNRNSSLGSEYERLKEYCL